MDTRQGILTRKVKSSGNPKNQESVSKQFGKEIDYLKARQSRLQNINDFRLKMHLGTRQDKREIGKQYIKDYERQKQTKKDLNKRQQRIEGKLHRDMLHKIKQENQVEKQRKQMKKNWAKECYTDNQYLSNQRVNREKKNRLTAQKKEKEDIKYNIMSYKRNFL